MEIAWKCTGTALLAVRLQRGEPPQQRPDSQGQQMGKMVLVLKRSFHDTFRVARDVLEDPQELAVANEKLSQAQDCHEARCHGDQAEQAFDVLPRLEPLKDDEEQSGISDIGGETALRCKGMQRHLVPCAELKRRVCVWRP